MVVVGGGVVVGAGGACYRHAWIVRCGDWPRRERTGRTSIADLTSLADGPHVLRVQARRPEGRTGPC